jgi:hypothetical protein
MAWTGAGPAIQPIRKHAPHMLDHGVEVGKNAKKELW